VYSSSDSDKVFTLEQPTCHVNVISSFSESYLLITGNNVNPETGNRNRKPVLDFRNRKCGLELRQPIFQSLAEAVVM